MKDQVNALTQAGIPAAYLNSSLTERQFDLALKKIADGTYRIVYVAPERLMTQRFLRIASQIEISMVAVDEAHCISQWGQDFRPSYLEIPDFINQLPKRPRLCAFTATATRKVKEDIIRLLHMHEPFIRVTGFSRPNLYLSVIRTKEKEEKLLELLNTYRGFSGIVYCSTRKNVESVCETLLAHGYPATRYHAGLSEDERRCNQEDFIYDRAPIMVATNAFGMGIDKSNVRFVIHYNMPKDIESYYQEAGRAGRDGERADCHLIFHPQDIVLQNFFIEKMGEEADLDPQTLISVQNNARLRLRMMANYCQTTQCLRSYILRYFGEDSNQNCMYCVNCLVPADVQAAEAAASTKAKTKSKAKTKADELDEDIDKALFDKLRQLRIAISKVRSVPPYVICHDSTLVDMCRQKPTTLEEMRFIKGMGEVKIRSIGASFAKAIAEYIEENE